MQHQLHYPYQIFALFKMFLGKKVVPLRDLFNESDADKLAKFINDVSNSLGRMPIDDCSISCLGESRCKIN